MLELPIPIARTPEDIVLATRATREAFIPGFLLTPHLLGEDIVRLAESLEPRPEQPILRPEQAIVAEPILKLMGLDSSDVLGFSAIQHRTVEGEQTGSHTDILYEDIGFWVCGRTDQDMPREIEMSTVVEHIDVVDLELGSVLPFHAKVIFRGQASLGWGMCLLSRSREESSIPVKQKRTAHRVAGGGRWMRFGPHDRRGRDIKSRSLGATV